MSSDHTTGAGSTAIAAASSEWLDVLGTPAAIIDHHQALVAVNTPFRELIERRRPDAVVASGQTLASLLPELAAEIPDLSQLGASNELRTLVREVRLPDTHQIHDHLIHLHRTARPDAPHGCWWSLLLVDISHVRRAERSNRSNLEVEMLLSHISARLVGNDDPLPAIEASLADIGRFMQATETFVLLLQPETDIVESAAAWHRDGCRSPAADLRGKALPTWWFTELRGMEMIEYGNLRDLPPIARQELLDHGGATTGALQIIPLGVDQRLAGAIGVYHDRPRRQSLPTQAVALDLFAHVMERFVHLNWKDTALRRSHRDLKEKQVQLVQSEKMATIGQMAAGIAHEINNPIGFVMSNLSTLQDYAGTLKALLAFGQAALPHLDQLSPEVGAQLAAIDRGDLEFITGDLDSLLSESIEGCERVRDIVQNLKGFARTDDHEPQPADLNACVDSTLKIVWNELKYRCDVVKDYGDLPPVICRAGEINQVIMNLLINAAHAIAGQGTITIKTRHNDTEAMLSVTDTGCGIPPGNLDRLFDPFFTTKSAGKGTGLGLNICHNIIERHAGRITVASMVGVGTTFTVHLPMKRGADDVEDIIG